MNNSFEKLASICRLNLQRLIDSKKIYADAFSYVERLERELEVYRLSGYYDIILIIQDYINWSKKNGIVVGPGRGSAAGSLVVYLSGITTIDPIRFGLIFERFMNPGRISLPDIDSDFSDRDKVIEYLQIKYGINRIARVGVPSLFKPRSAIDEFARSLGIPFEEAKLINKLVTEDTFDESLKANPQLKIYIDKYPLLFDLAKKSIGSTHHITTHPSAVILAAGPIGRSIPLTRSRGEDQVLVTQWDGEELDSLGFVKLDILTVDNLAVINSTASLLPENIRKNLDVYDLPINDRLTLKGFENGETVGVFQFEEAKSVSILKSLPGITFDEVCAVNALIRPGLDVDQFISARNNHSTIKYTIPQLEPILRETNGVILYQEQVMKICSELAGFSMAEADKVRKIIAKTANQRAVDGLTPVYEKFKEGYLKSNLDPNKFEELWQKILACQNYIFNKSHGYAYGMIAYIDMYLKTHFPIEFMCSSLRSKSRENIIKECRRLRIKILPPDVNLSEENYSIQTLNGERIIRLGLENVKHVGSSKKIIQKRPYASIEDFVLKEPSRQNAIDSLACAGAFDSFMPRQDALTQIKGIEPTQTEMAMFEKESIGFYLFANPLEQHNDVLQICIDANSNRTQNAKVGGMIVQVKHHQAKTGMMAFCKLMTLDGEIEVVMWPSDFAAEGHRLKVGNIFISNGKLTDRGSYSIKNLQMLSEDQRKEQSETPAF